MKTTRQGSWGLTAAGAIGLAFGLLTVLSGGMALFGTEATRAAAGNAVPFVLWFNFLAGFAYILAGLGLLRQQRAVAWLSAAIAVSTVIVLAALAAHVANGGLYEMRTVAAMLLRATVWACIAAIALRSLRT